MSGRAVKVLIIDDSLIMRELLHEILSEDPGIEVVGAAEDALVAREMIKERDPDVITLDIDMPRMDGLEFLRRLMKLRPMPAVVISSHIQPGGAMTIEALEMGAVDCVGKPSGADTHSLLSLGDEIITKVKDAANADMRAAQVRALRWRARNEQPGRRRLRGAGFRLVGIGASMGGVQALCRIVPHLPADAPPIVICQHMPAGFTSSFAARLDRLSPAAVHEARDDLRLEPGNIYLAPGGCQLSVAEAFGSLSFRISHSTADERHAPSIDRLFGSMAVTVGPGGLGVLLTGMGKDGAQGLLRLRHAGGTTVCQNRETSLVYGMPKAAVEIGAVERELALADIAALIAFSSGTHRQARTAASRAPRGGSASL